MSAGKSQRDGTKRQTETKRHAPTTQSDMGETVCVQQTGGRSASTIGRADAPQPMFQLVGENTTSIGLPQGRQADITSIFEPPAITNVCYLSMTTCVLGGMRQSGTPPCLRRSVLGDGRQYQVLTTVFFIHAGVCGDQEWHRTSSNEQ